MYVFIKNNKKELEIKEFPTTNLNKNTKKAQRFLKLYSESNIVSLYEAYKKPSRNKITIYNRLNYFKMTIGGFYQKIITFNNQFFTFAYRLHGIDGDYLIIETPCYRYSIKL